MESGLSNWLSARRAYLGIAIAALVALGLIPGSAFGAASGASGGDVHTGSFSATASCGGRDQYGAYALAHIRDVNPGPYWLRQHVWFHVGTLRVPFDYAHPVWGYDIWYGPYLAPFASLSDITVRRAPGVYWVDVQAAWSRDDGNYSYNDVVPAQCNFPSPPPVTTGGQNWGQIIGGVLDPTNINYCQLYPDVCR